jgi:hypothetical protein
VTPTTIVLGPNGGTLTLRASDGSVDWSIGESSSLVGDVTVAPAAGTLSAGESATVTLSVSGSLDGLRVATAAYVGGGGGGGGGGGCSCGGDDGSGADGGGACAQGTLTVNPGGITVSVALDVGTCPSPGCSPSPSSSPPDDAVLDGLAARLVD